MAYEKPFISKRSTALDVLSAQHSFVYDLEADVRLRARPLGEKFQAVLQSLASNGLGRENEFVPVFLVRHELQAFEHDSIVENGIAGDHARLRPFVRLGIDQRELDAVASITTQTRLDLNEIGGDESNERDIDRSPTACFMESVSTCSLIFS